MKYLLTISLILNIIGTNAQEYYLEGSYKSNLPFIQSITIQQREQIKEKLKTNCVFLEEKGILNTYDSSKDILFGFPLKSKDDLNDPGFYTVSSYVDHDSLFPGHLQDFNCGELTYDTDEGYNHQGTDFLLWPFPWYKMDNNQVEVVAAAPGIIIYKQDGNFDRNCNGEDSTWNAVFILHSNGYTTWYGHLKDGSITEKEVGEEVELGEYLGIVGSSGISIQPHLHFEVYDEENKLIDPYEGPCNPDLNESLWLDQKPYIDAGINRIATNSTLPVYHDCPQQETLNESSDFHGNDTIFLLLYFRNLSQGDNVEITITRPDNSIHSHWTWESDLTNYIASWNYWFLILQGDQDGTWKFEAKYNNEIYIHEFHYTNAASINENKIQGLVIFPNPVSKKVKISFPDPLSKDLIFRITNLMGQKMDVFPELNEDGKSFLLDCNRIPDGSYIISIEANEKHYRGHFIKR